MRAEFNVVGAIMTLLLAVVVIGLTFVLISVGVVGEVQKTAQEEKGVLLCDNAIQAIVNNPGKQGEDDCQEKFCIASDYDSKSCWRGTNSHWEISECAYAKTYPGEKCDCRRIFTGLTYSESPKSWCTRRDRDKYICVTTGGYNTPGLQGKIDVYKVCGYDMTDSNECVNGKLTDERSALWFRVGRMISLACEHGRDLNKVDDFPVFVEVCKVRLAVRDYDNTDTCELRDAVDTSYSLLITERSKLLDTCVAKSGDRGAKMLECAKHIKLYGTSGPDPESLYRYYLCVSGAGNANALNLPCNVEYVSGGGASAEYKIVYKKNGNKVVIGPATSFPGKEANFCG